MKLIAKEFLSSFSGTIRCFPPTFRQVYTNRMAEFGVAPDSKGYDLISPQEGFEDLSRRGVAHRMYWWFPTHFFKFQDALLRCEEKHQKKNGSFILNKPQVTFVDLGCGAGAASVAVLSVIEQYQLYLQKKGIRTDAIIVNLIALDPCQEELDVYEAVVGEYASKLSEYKIAVSTHTICQPFPQGASAIIEGLQPIRGNVIIVGMSNLINWIWNEVDSCWETDELHGIEELQPDEVLALKEITLKSEFDILVAIGIATKNKKRWWLSDKLSVFIDKLLKLLRLSKHIFGETWRINAEVLFENPEGSRWAKQRAQATSRYFVESIVDTDPVFYRDEKLHKALTPDTLEKAWVKAQNYISYEALVDRVELKLFEVDYALEIEKLRYACLDRITRSLNVEYDFPYTYPKNNETDRPKSLARLEEQIISIAVSLVHQDELKGRCPSVSFSFRLAPEDSEFLYQYWFQLYSKYFASILQNLDDKQVCTSDIKSFYTNIRQSILLGILSRRIGTSKRCIEMFDAIIRRDCHNGHVAGYGILQGHAISGLLANVMLQPVDDQLVSTHGMKNRYFRFADDVTFTGIESSNPIEQIDEIVKFQNLLRDHDKALELNIQKTKKYESEREFKNKIGGNKEFDESSARFRKLLLPLFVMDRDYRREFNRIGWHFVYEYQKLLEDIGIYFSPEWLYRKLDEYTRPRKLVASQIKILRGGYSIDLPQLSLNSSRQGRLRWARLFRESNAKWLEEKQVLSQKLSMMFQHSARIISNEAQREHDTTWYTKMIKFSLYRLSVFGISEIANQISMLLISQPWNIPVWLSCRGLARAGLETELFQIINESQSSYVRSMAIKALGSIRTASSVERLASVLDDDAEMIEKLMASEALLDSNFWHGIQYPQIKSWINQMKDEPYVLKNLVLILAQAYPEQLFKYLSSVQYTQIHPIVNRAIHYAKTKPPTENLLWRSEPEIIRKYRAQSYPIIEELLQDEGSYKIASP